MEEKTGQFLAALDQAQLLGTIPSGLFLVDVNQYIVYWNPEAERITGYPAAEAIGQHCSFLAGIECGSACGLFDADAQQKPIIGAECHITTKHGEQLVVVKNIDYLKQDGQIVGGIESFVDITPQKQLEEKLRRHGDELELTVRQRTESLEQERTRLRSVLDAMIDPAYIVTADFQVAFINRAMQERFGASKGRLCYRLLHNRDEPCEDCPWPKTRKGQIINEERRFGQNGRIYEIVHTPVHNPQGELEKLAVCRDITERKEAAEKLMELNRHLDSFVYTVSHDLRSPLTPIIGFAEFLREEYRDRLDNQALNLLQEIESQGGRMLDLMEDLLELSRVGYLPPPEQPVDVAAIIRQIEQDNQAEITEQGIRITLDELPAAPIPETLAYELFSNLLINAVRYGCSPGDSIEIGGTADKHQVSYHVADHGPGISEKEREKVCNVFFRGAAANGTRGTGIGLATAHKIVRLYNGAIHFEQTAGGGCTVRVTFPTE